MLEAPAQAVSSGGRRGRASATARSRLPTCSQRLVRALVPAQDRPQDHAARGRRGAGARAPSDARRAQPRRLPAGRGRGGHAGAHRARHRHGAAGLGGLRRQRHVGEVHRQRAGLGAGQAADRHHPARGAAEGGELAGPHPGSDRRRDHPRPQDRQRRRRRVARGRTARSRSTISAPAIRRSRGCASFRSASSRSTAAM